MSDEGKGGKGERQRKKAPYGKYDHVCHPVTNREINIDWFHNLCMLLRADLSLIQRLVAKQYLKSD